jgi:hypothetical protein
MDTRIAARHNLAAPSTRSNAEVERRGRSEYTEVELSTPLPPLRDQPRPES